MPGSPSAAAAAAPGRAGAPPPPMGWLAGGALPGGPAPPDSLATDHSSGSGTSGFSQAPPPAAPDLGPYKVRSQDEIQRAYDAATGPPSKGAVNPGDGQRPLAGAPPPAAAGAESDGGNQSVGDELPAPPPPITGTGSRGAGGPMSEYEELQKRFEALKKT
jgi:hypothetical protein